MKLNELSKSDCALILRIECDDKLKSRLNSFGLTRNSKIKVLEQTLNKNTIEIRINTTNIALRQTEAEFIEVEKIECNK